MSEDLGIVYECSRTHWDLIFIVLHLSIGFKMCMSTISTYIRLFCSPAVEKELTPKDAIHMVEELCLLRIRVTILVSC